MLSKHTISFTTNHTEGIVSFIKTHSKVSDIVSANIVSIDLPSLLGSSRSPYVIFGINNPTYSYYCATAYTITDPKFFYFDFKNYSLAINGISMKTDDIDWFDEYYLEGFFNEQETDANITIKNSNFPDKEWQHFNFTQTKPCRYFNLSVVGKSHKQLTYFAIYGIEFFGDVYYSQNHTPTCQCHFHHYFKLVYHLVFFLSETRSFESS